MQNAVNAVNAVGLDLHRALRSAGGGNALISPLSIQTALAMTFAGAASSTRDEMARVLRFDQGTTASFGALLRTIAVPDGDAIAIAIANRLFVQSDFELRRVFVELVARTYAAEPVSLDFAKTEAARAAINDWVAAATRDKIRDLVPPRVLDAATRLVLANALYLRASWEERFAWTANERFVLDGGAVEVPTMSGKVGCGYGKTRGCELLSLPLAGGLQFVVALPKRPDGLAALEDGFDLDLLASARSLPYDDRIVYLPKLRITPPSLSLKDALGALGLREAFDDPRGSADFDGIAPRAPDAYLFIGEVLHKTFCAVDQDGIEAAAATAVMMPLGAGAPRKQPETVRVDRPFFFAVQHVASGACLFVGRVTDPRSE